MRRSPLDPLHRELSATFTSFSGYVLPLYYSSIVKEHLTVRDRVGIFDVSHMGRIRVSGESATDFLNYVTANDVEKLYDGKMQYSLILNESGGIKDDITVYRLSSNDYILVVNAANREKILDWLLLKKDPWGDISIIDVTDDSSMFAIQGPYSKMVYEEYFSASFNLKRFHFWNGTDPETGQAQIIVSRSGYTGEDGFEMIMFTKDKMLMMRSFKTLLSIINSYEGLPCGLGARDSLRLEAGYCLYGNDIDEDTNPYEASLGWVVKMYKTDFIGKKALENVGEPKRIRTGLVMEDRSIPRRGNTLHVDGDAVGIVTSGGYSPILLKGIGMVYVDTKYSLEETEVYVSVRGRVKKGVIKGFPLYDPERYGFTRKSL